MLVRIKSALYLWSLGFLIISNAINFTYAIDQHCTVLLHNLNEESVVSLAESFHSITETIKEELNADDGANIKFVIYDQNQKEHVVSSKTLEEALVQNHENPLSVENGEKLPGNRSFFRNQNVLHTPFIAFETRFWPGGTEQLPIEFSKIEALEEAFNGLSNIRFRIKAFQPSGSRIAAILEPTADTKELWEKIMARYTDFFTESMKKELPGSVLDIFDSIKSAENVEQEAKRVASDLISRLSSEDNFVKEDAAAIIIQFCSAISDRRVSPYVYGRWFSSTGLEGNAKTVNDYLAYSVPSFMKGISWQPRMSLISLIARDEDQSGENMQAQNLPDVANTSINQQLINKLNESIQEKDIDLIFQKAVFNKGEFLATYDFN